MLTPGAETQLRIWLDVEDYDSDHVDTTICLRTAAGGAFLKVAAEIEPEFEVSPQVLDFGDVRIGGRYTRSLRVVGRTARISSRSLRVTAPEHIEHTLEFASATTPGSGESGATVTVVFEPVRPGTVNAELVVQTDAKRMAVQRVPVRANVAGLDATVTPRVMVFNSVRPGATAAVMVVTAQEPIAIVSATVPSEALVVEKDPAKGKRHELAVRVAADAEAMAVAGVLRLELSNGAASEVREIPVYGSIAGERD